MELKVIEKDVLIIGGGTAGCYAAGKLAEMSGLSVLVAEKADVRRSGCLAAGVNALNAYITPGHTPDDYVDYAKKDAEGIVREDLLLTLSERLNLVTKDLERIGLAILKDAEGNYVSRGWRNLKINGENIKPLLAEYAGKAEKVEIRNHINVTDLLTEERNGKRSVRGAVGFGTDREVFYLLYAKAVLIATGGASGLYRPNDPGRLRHRMWYCPFNTGAGYAMGLLAGAEMTTLEMRFIALRCKDTLAPTGTIAQGTGAGQINSRGEDYGEKYGLSTSERVWGTVEEKRQGRGPCYLGTSGIPKKQEEDLYRAYLNMAPMQTLKWLAGGKGPSSEDVEIDGSEPYIVGGHTASGYWVSTGRETTIRGLFAAGDVCGGAPQKYVTGALAEALIAAEGIIKRCGEGAGAAEPACEEEAVGPAEQALEKTAAGSAEQALEKTAIGQVEPAREEAAGVAEPVRKETAGPAAQAREEEAAGIMAQAREKAVAGSAAPAEQTITGSWDEIRAGVADEQALGILAEYRRYLSYLSGEKSPFSTEQVEEAMQKVMDEYAGGITAGYRYNEAGLEIADERIRELKALQEELRGHSADELLQIYELRDRLIVSEALIAHLRARKETRWHSFQENSDYPEKSGDYERYVNSRMENGRIRILYRPLTGRRDSYEHTD